MLTNRQKLSLIVNLGLLCFALVMAFSGLLIQIAYHMGHHGNISINNNVLALGYYNWSVVHKLSAVIVILLMIIHMALHWKVQIAVFRRKPSAKSIQLTILSVVFVLVAITGFLPWFIHLAKGVEVLRKTFIEVHDKLAIVLVIYLILHVIKRRRWYLSIFKKL
jgi:hypothetical protein